MAILSVSNLSLVHVVGSILTVKPVLKPNSVTRVGKRGHQLQSWVSSVAMMDGSVCRGDLEEVGRNTALGQLQRQEVGDLAKARGLEQTAGQRLGSKPGKRDELGKQDARRR